MKLLRSAAYVSGFVFLLLFCLQASPQNFRGSIVGTVLDASGARVASAKITVVQKETPTNSRETTSGSQGEFRVDDLLPGAYVVTVKAAGFADATSDVSVLVSTARDLTVNLIVAAASSTVNVQGTASSITTESIDTTSAVHQSVVTAHDLNTIPLAARSFANIAYLAPGTEPVEPSDPTKARITAVSTGGSSGLNNQLSVDGGDDSDDYIGGFLQNISPDAIQEFAFKTAGEDADTGGTTAGAAVITTKRGTDEWHGGAAFYERDASLNARAPIDNPAPNPKQPFSRQNYIGTIGGPIVKTETPLFRRFRVRGGACEHRLQRRHTHTISSTGNVSVRWTDSRSDLDPNAQQHSRAVPRFFGDARLDYDQSARSEWFLRYAADNYTTQNDLVQQGTLPTTGATSHSNYMNMVLGNSFSFSPTWLGLLTIDASYLHHTEARNQDLGFALAFPFSSTTLTTSGFETFGDNQFATPITAFPVLRNQEKYQLRYDVSHTMGNHTLRFGVNFIHEPVLSGALSGTAEILHVFTMDPTDYLGNEAQFTHDLNCDCQRRLDTTCSRHSCGQRQLFAKCATPRRLRGRFMAHNSATHRELRTAVRHNFWLVRSFGTNAG